MIDANTTTIIVALITVFGTVVGTALANSSKLDRVAKSQEDQQKNQKSYQESFSKELAALERTLLEDIAKNHEKIEEHSREFQEVEEWRMSGRELQHLLLRSFRLINKKLKGVGVPNGETDKINEEIDEYFLKNQK